MKHSVYIIIGVALLLFASCGQQQKAKSVVKDFMDAYPRGEVSYLEFSDVDSTNAISDSLISVLQARAGKNMTFQKRTSKMLILLRAKYLLNDDTCSTTFYMNPDFEGVVAFKEN